MAKTRAHDRERARARAHADTADKENIPPKKKPKKTVPLNGMFQKSSDRTSESSRSFLGPGFGGVAKKSHRSCSKMHPIVVEFSAVVNAYRTSVAASEVEQIGPVYDALVSRVKGLTLGSERGQTANAPTKSDFDRLKEQENALRKPLGEDVLTIERDLPDGSSQSTEHLIRKTMSKFERTIETDQSEIEGLWQELDDVNAQIADLVSDLLENGENDEQTAADAKLEKECGSLGEEIDNITRQTFTDITTARREDQASAAEANRRLEEFVSTF